MTTYYNTKYILPRASAGGASRGSFKLKKTSKCHQMPQKLTIYV